MRPAVNPKLAAFDRSMRNAIDKLNEDGAPMAPALVFDITTGGQPFKVRARSASEEEASGAIARLEYDKTGKAWKYVLLRPELIPEISAERGA